MPKRPKALSFIFIGLLFVFVILAANLISSHGELGEAQRLLKQLEDENRNLKNEVEQLKEKNKQLESQLYKQKLLSLERETGLVRVKDVDDAIILDLRYATKNNFTGQVLYPVTEGLLQRGTAEKLKKANERFIKDGYRIKVWDAYRPLDIQKRFWALVPDRRYVANPAFGSKHNRGSAVDITLVDQNGNELEMPTEFDHFSEKAWRDYRGNTAEAQQNMEYLTRIMVENGFNPAATEWWHFDDSAWGNYPVMNVPLEDFSSE